MEAQASRVRGQVPRGCWRIEEDDARRPEEVAGRASQRLDVPKAGQGSESKEEMPQNLCRWQWAQRCIWNTQSASHVETSGRIKIGRKGVPSSEAEKILVRSEW